MPFASEELLEAMQKPETYDEPAGEIRMVQTHISWVFLTGNFAYKIKKPVDFGFLDFTTLEKRKRLCKRELEINRMFSPEIYLAVLPLNIFRQNIKLNGPGETIEYAIKMRQLPQEKLMNTLLDRNEVGTDIIGKIVDKIIDFYSKTQTYRLPGSTGSLDTVRFNWKENFRQVEPFIGKTIDQKTFDEIKTKVTNFMDKNKDVFDKRLREGRVKWCHGDLHSGNIFVVEGKVYIFDAIEFNERFACSDVANDIAFLSMDLDFRHRTYLSDFLVKKYMEKSGDGEVMKLLDFYKCYRAYVRGKVTGFRLNDPHVLDFEKEEAKDVARSYFRLALEYSKKF
jgi:hypothetical protein